MIVVLIDDLGFAGTSTFGGPVQTPTFDRIAAEGLHYNNFHTTAVCSPTRAALKSGRNHHRNNMGGIIETGTAFPGNTGQIPNSVTPLAEILRVSTATAPVLLASGTRRRPGKPAFPALSIAGRRSRASTSSTAFSAVRRTSGHPTSMTARRRWQLPEDEDYHFLTDMTDQAVAWIKYQKALTPDRPFFVYFAPGATHAPHHVPKEWIERWERQVRSGLGCVA